MPVKSTIREKLHARYAAACRATSPEELKRAIDSAYALGQREGVKTFMRGLADARKPTGLAGIARRVGLGV